MSNGNEGKIVQAVFSQLLEKPINHSMAKLNAEFYSICIDQSYEVKLGDISVNLWLLDYIKYEVEKLPERSVFQRLFGVGSGGSSQVLNVSSKYQLIQDFLDEVFVEGGEVKWDGHCGTLFIPTSMLNFN